MSFYLTLPSDSSMDFFPENKISHFSTQLPTPINLNDEWEVALSEIMYPHTWYNINHKSNSFVCDLGDGQKLTRKIPSGYYETLHDIIKAMNFPSQKNKIDFNFNAVTKKVKVKTYNGAKVLFSEGLCEVLGFHPGIVEGVAESLVTADLNSAFPVIYVYSDIVLPQVIGHVQAPLLRIVKVKGKDGETVNFTYDRPHYVPIVRHHIQTITIELRLNSGELVPFERGKVIVVLHFRKRNVL